MRTLYVRLATAVLLLTVVLSHGLSGQETKTGLTTHEAVMMQQIGAAQLSPDGKTIVYSLIVPRTADEKDGGARSQLRLMNYDGSNDRLLIGHSSGAAAFRWSPDGKAIHFLARRDGDAGATLYALPTDGGEASRVFAPRSSIKSYDVSPDQKWVAYVANRPADPAKAALQKKGFNQRVFEEDDPTPELVLHELATKKETVIELNGAPWDPSFSPDGRHLAYWWSPSARIDDKYMARKLHVTDLLSLKSRRLVDTPGKVGNFAWSPSGRNIAYVAGRNPNDPKEGAVGIAALEGGAVKLITPAEFEGHCASVFWRSEKVVGFLTTEGCLATVSEQDAAGGEIRQLLEGTDRIYRSAHYRRASAQFALVVDTPRHPRELYNFEFDRNGPPTRLSTSNDWLADRDLGPQEVVKYTARDGLALEGLLIRPVDHEKGGRRPLIVVVHGGPEACYSNGWLSAYSMPGQVAAAKGYYVFYPNYRSSTGRGLAFSMLGQRRSGLEEFDDVVDGVKHLVNEGLVDEKRVGITGGSYGGYASAWGATFYSDVFAASVMFVGISDQLSKVFTTDIPNESYLVHWRMRPWEDNWDKFLKASPIYYIKKAKTPILIAHGDQDPRVSPTQSMELYRALKLKGDVPVRLVLYPGEGHGNRRRGSRLDYGLRQMRWFDHYLVVDKPKAKPPIDISYDVEKN